PVLFGGPILAVWQKLTEPFFGLFDKNLSIVGAAYLLLCTFWATLVWALFGGTITRIAALAITRDESVTMQAALLHVWKRLGSYFFSPYFPLVGVLLALLPFMLLGLLMRIQVGMLIAGLIWPVVLV